MSNQPFAATGLEHDDERVEVAPDDALDDRWRCLDCDEELEIERRQSENNQITECVA